MLWTLPGSNWSPPHCYDTKGGPKRTRTADPLIANEVLYQLSYGPTFGIENPRLPQLNYK